MNPNPGVGRTGQFVRQRISPRLTDLSARLGHANRQKLTENLHLLSASEQEQARVIDLLVQKGILKGQFSNLSSLLEIEEFMLSGRITADGINSLDTGLQQIFPGTSEIINNLSYGIFQAQSSLLTQVVTGQQGTFNLALGLGVATAGVIGGTLLGVPASYLLGGAAIYSLVSIAVVNRVNPHSLAGKMFEMGSRMLPFVISANLLYGSYNIFTSGFMFTEAVMKYFGNLPLVGLGVGLAATVGWTARDVIRAFSSNHGFLRPLSKWNITKTLWWSNFKIFTGINYLSYRTIMTLAFAIGAFAFHVLPMTPLGLAVFGIGLGVRIGLPLLAQKYPFLRRERMTEWVSNKVEKGIKRINRKTVILPNGQSLIVSGAKGSDNLIAIKVHNGTKIISLKATLKDGKAPPQKAELKTLLEQAKNNIDLKDCYTPELEKALQIIFKRANRYHYHPLDKLAVEYVTGMIIKYGVLLGSCFSSPDPLAMLFDLTTIYFASWTLAADGHSGFASFTSAVNWKRGIFNPEDALLTDAELRGTHDFCARMVAYINDAERNFSKLVNMLIMEYPHQEVELCGELYPYANLNAVKQLRSARAVHQLLREKRDKLYAKFHPLHADLLNLNFEDPDAPAKVQAMAEQIAKVLDKLGDLYSDLESSDPNAPTPFPTMLRNLIEEDKKRPAAERWFKLEGEESFVRMAYEAIRLRGLRFHEMARRFQEMAKQSAAKHEDLVFFTKETLGIFSVKANHVQRKIDYLDDKLSTKTFNLSWAESHMGDTLYHVWRLVPQEGGKYLFRPNYVPSTHVRINNPHYNHMQGDKPENQRFIWVRREDFLEVLGISQAMSNEIQLVNNTPDSQVEETIGLVAGHQHLIVHGFFSNEELLPPKHLIDWDGKTVPLDDATWVAGQNEPPSQFRDHFKAWASNHYGKDYAGWIEKQGSNAIWFIDEPEALILAPNANYNVCDEAYIVIDTERVLQAEINHTAKEDKIVRVINYDTWAASFPNPDPSRDVQHVVRWRLQDSPVGIRYTTKDNQSFNVPYMENRAMFVKGADGEDWMDIDYGLIKKGADNKEYIEIYAKDGRKLGRVDTEWPHHMHPSDQIATVTVKENGQDQTYPKIDFDVFAERVGMGTWLVADYGDNYGTAPHERYRTSFLDFDTEAKKQFWPNFIRELSVSNDKKRLTFRTTSTNCESFPFDKKWSDIGMAAETNILKVNTSGEAYVDPQAHTWSPVKDDQHTEKAEKGLVQVRSADGQEAVFGLNKLPRGLTFLRKPSLKELRKVIDGELVDGKLVFQKLRRKNPIKDTPTFMYSLKNGSVEDPNHPEYKRLQWRLAKEDLTVHISKNGENYALELSDQNGKRIDDLSLSAADLVDNSGKGFLQTAWNKMNSIDSFYQREDRNYTGSEEYRPHLVQINGRIKLILTRVEKVAVDESKETAALYQYLSSATAKDKSAKVLLAQPTSAVKVQALSIAKAKVLAAVPEIEKDLKDFFTFKEGSKGEILVINPNIEGLLEKTTLEQATKEKLLAVVQQNKTEKWVPMSLSKAIAYNETPNNMTIGVRQNGKTLYTNKPLVGELPPLTYLIKYDHVCDGFFAYTIKSARLQNGALDFQQIGIGRVSDGIERQIRDAIGKEGMEQAKKEGIEQDKLPDGKKRPPITIEIFYTRPPEVIDGVYQSVVHGQRQHGTFFKAEAFVPAEQGQFRDEYFYAIIAELFSEAFPPGREPRSGGVQTGKVWDFDENDKWSGKPIENGTQFVGNHRHLFELAEVLMGIPKGGLITFGMALERSGGFEKILHKPHFAKLVLYCREKGWLSGVSEDEQGVLALALALGYALKYFLRTTAFEAQPTTYGQLDTQDDKRYNTALELGTDVLMPYEFREIRKRLTGKRFAGTLKQKMEHLAFRLWYEFPKAELARQISPVAFLMTSGRVKPYIVDPYFLLSWGADFGAGLAMYSTARDMLGRNKETTSMTRIGWSFLEGPAMSQAFLFQGHRGIVELFRKGWQYGQFVVTALSKAPNVQEENKNYLQHLITLQGSSIAFGLAMTLPGAIAMGQPGHAFSLDYLFNEFWGAYAMFINKRALNYIKRCEIGNPEGKGPEAEAFLRHRMEVVKEIDKASDAVGTRFFTAYKHFRNGEREQAIEMWNAIIAEDAPYKMMNYVLESERMLEELGKPLPNRGKMTEKGPKLNVWGNWK